MSNAYMTAKTQRCFSCGDLVSREESVLSEGRKVISARNANKQVSPDRYSCFDCHAAAEYKQFVYRIDLTIEMARGMDRNETREEIVESFLAIERRNWAPVLAKRAKGRR
jgi:DNA-directed RNA polymerase subunit N (RpoN/RPB10)